MSNPSILEEVAKQVHESAKPYRVTVRTLLSWFNAQRRGTFIVWLIKGRLRFHKLESVPDFSLVYIDSYIELRPLIENGTKVQAKHTDGAESQSQTVDSEAQIVANEIKDPVPRLGMLAAANRSPVSIARDALTSEAVTLMLINDFSQLPVLQGDRIVNGMITWKSIGKQRALGKEVKYVRECMETDVVALNLDTSLFDAVASINEREVVLVKSDDNRIVGLVTTSDISQQFKTLSESFLLLAEIENHIRLLINAKYTLKILRSASDPSDANRIINSIADLTFGEYIRLLENPENWTQLGYNLDRATFVARLNELRRIRNDVMHFHPDGISEDDLDMLRQTVKFFQEMK